MYNVAQEITFLRGLAVTVRKDDQRKIARAAIEKLKAERKH